MTTDLTLRYKHKTHRYTYYIRSTNFHIITMQSIFSPVPRWAAEWFKIRANGRKLAACSRNAFVSIAPSLWTTLYICSCCFHRSYNRWSTTANCTTIFTEYVRVFISLLPGGLGRAKSVINSLTTCVCLWNAMTLFAAPFCTARSAGAQTAKRSCPFAPPAVNPSHHCMVT